MTDENISFIFIIINILWEDSIKIGGKMGCDVD
jgi:hypothetical protein